MGKKITKNEVNLISKDAIYVDAAIGKTVEQVSYDERKTLEEACILIG